MFSKKNKKKAFTLIEMLIVIVIIGILMAAIYPRLSNARGRANDVARKADLAQVAAALVSYQIDRWQFPTAAWSLSLISWNLISAGMNSIPTDPNASRVFSGIAWWTAGQYSYTPITKWWLANNWFVLMAGTETEWWSNWVVGWSVGIINSTTDYANIKLCKSFTPTSSTPTNDDAGNCTYNKNADNLRYIYLY